MESKMTEKLGAVELAEQFSNLNKADFQAFWMHVAYIWNHEESELEAQWFYNSQGAKHTVQTVIGALHSAVYSGVKSGAKP